MVLEQQSKKPGRTYLVKQFKKYSTEYLLCWSRLSNVVGMQRGHCNVVAAPE
jgi:hypothetical protein